MTEVQLWQWGLIIASSLVLFFLSPLAKNTSQFFKAVQKKRTPNTFMLMGSLIISWIFAKSITNAANLGLDYGIVGGVAYAGYYVSFAVAGIVIYRMRLYGKYTSIHHFLSSKFGKGAVAVFSVLIAIRYSGSHAARRILIKKTLTMNLGGHRSCGPTGTQCELCGSF